MIEVVDVDALPARPLDEGDVTRVLPQPANGGRTSLALYTIRSGRALTFRTADDTQVLYLLDGADAKIEHEVGAAKHTYVASRRAGICLAATESATVAAGQSVLRLLWLSVPRYRAKATSGTEPTGYFFDEKKLRSLVDAKQVRERTFWVNREVGLSGSWDLQLGRMRYAPRGSSPRHVHHASESATTVPEHFYLIEEGRGTVKHDTGSVPVEAGSLVLIPAGSWHQLIASDTGLDYIEFQAPFDFVTTMDNDPLGKNWYIKGTDDGTGNPCLWVQS
jgi:mannose-6-phosphate isomerase-like protein (cupin superfamily)